MQARHVTLIAGIHIPFFSFFGKLGTKFVDAGLEAAHDGPA